MSVPTSVRLSQEVADKLETLAKKTGRSQSYYIRQAVEQSIDRLAWEHDLAQHARDLRAGREKTIPLEKLVEELGLDS